ncbi:hypothetical protein ACH5RR_033073 [Cinchona calisaya]|uniref:Agenet domain-containing protein n=1 Tax=Cinchona calisaya TaxID=153742 RepID=A0ABD2YL88_9GENT
MLLRLFGVIMGKDSDQHFEIGQLVEARSFMKGYRGAWFRCKITDTSRKNGHIGHVLHYLDFPDEKDKWTRLYQIPPTGKKKGPEIKRQIMVRPSFPPVYRESQMPPASTISEVIVITKGIWNIGDLVDWFKDGCYWSAKVTQILGNEEAMVELMPPPLGEGSSYKASFSDLRPSLDWSPKNGWTLPNHKDGGHYHQFARLIHPVNPSSGGTMGLEMPALSERITDGEAAAELSYARALSSHVSTKSSTASENMKTGGASDMVKESQVLPKEVMGTPEGLFIGEDLSHFSSPQKKLRMGISLNSTRSNTLEAAILDLEELANKIKWLKSILKFRSPLSNAVETSWTFLEHRGPSMP